MLEAPNSSWCNNMLQYVTIRQQQTALTLPASTPHFGGCTPRGYDPKFKLGRDFLYNTPTPKFHNPMYSRSEVIVLTNKQTHTHTNKQTNKQTNRRRSKTSNALRYATTLGNNCPLKIEICTWCVCAAWVHREEEIVQRYSDTDSTASTSVN